MIIFNLAWEHCKLKKMDDMKVMFVFIRVMLAYESYVLVNESSIYRLYIFLIRIVSRTPFLDDDLQSSEYTCNCKRFYTGLKG